MFCPDCKKEVELSRMDPQVSRVRLDGTMVRADVEINDLCAECYRVLQGAKAEASRSLQDVPALKGHEAHKWQIELLKSERILDPVNYASAKLTYMLTCDCGQLAAYQGSVFSSTKLVPVL